VPWQNGYYYRAKKINGRVVRTYVGKGLTAEAVAKIDAGIRALRREVAANLKEERARQEALAEQVALFCDIADILARDALAAAGFHQHKRGEWRRKRGQI
jgi:hypothetical protein